MSDKAEAAAAAPISGSRAYIVLGSLVAGLLAGAASFRLADGLRESALQIAATTGGIWLDGLRMTVIPLIVALLVTAIAQGAEAVRAGRVAGRSVLWFVIVCTSSAIFGAAAMSLLVDLFPLPQNAASALQASLATLDPSITSAPLPEVADFFKSVIPPNIFSAAVNDQILPLVVFALLFAIAVTRIKATRRRSLVAFFEAIVDAMLVMIGWVLWLAPIGVFGLAFAVGAGSGAAAFAGLVHYIVLISSLGIVVMLAGYCIAVFAGGVRPVAFAKAMIAPQTVAISTQSSLASLPAMLGSARMLGTREQVYDVTLPLSVALFRATGPAMNIGVAIYVAHWLGIEIGTTALIAGTAVAAVASYSAVSLPGAISFLSTIGPIAVAMGIPIAPLGLLVAVENIPDIFRTVGNVTLDVAVTAAVDRSTGDEAPEA